jgi:hypothetical protein
MCGQEFNCMNGALDEGKIQGGVKYEVPEPE